MSQSLWGSDQTQFFFTLTPDHVIQAVERAGTLCTGRIAALNSFENRVYDLELEMDPIPGQPWASHRVAKFYRPGRWSVEQILEEHAFLRELQEAEIPVIAPLPFEDGTTLKQTDAGIHFALFPRVGGRSPDEFSDELLLRVGRLLGRIHNVGAAHAAQHRLELTAQTYGEASLSYLLENNFLPLEIKSRYERVARQVIEVAQERLKGLRTLRVHGDCHPGNLLVNQQGPFFLDFDDCVRAPAVQDLWLLVPGRDSQAQADRELLLEGYCEMRAFDRKELHALEALRALRFMHYSAWIARRYTDPAFPRAFPEFGSSAYWADETGDLEQQLRLLLS